MVVRALVSRTRLQFSTSAFTGLTNTRPQQSVRLTHRRFSRSIIKMVEGHQCHRVAHFHRKKLLGKSFACSSPNGKFELGASQIDGKPLTRIEIHGKNLFYFFGGGDDTVVLHIHFGMSGKFALFDSSADSNISPKPTTRLEMKGHGMVAHLSAMTVQHGDQGFYEEKRAGLGEDPLRQDADPNRAWEKIRGSKSRSIGYLLMDQSVIAGVGNIYRAEILFKAGVHPEQPGNSLTRDVFDRIWYHSVDLLERGVRTGSILTVDESEGLPPPWTRRYIYNQSMCGRCGDHIKSWDIAGRTAYACPTCQPLTSHGALSADRMAAVKQAKGAVEFVSHCAADDISVAMMSPAKLKVSQLKRVLEEMNLPTDGKKADLVARVLDAQAIKKEEAVATPDQMDEGGQRRPKRRTADAGGDQKDRIKQKIDFIATAEQAAREKLDAGEKGNVEHVPLGFDDATNH